MKLAIALLAVLTLSFSISPVRADPKWGDPSPNPTLELTGENTVIVDATVYAGSSLQYYLLKFVAKSADAEDFKLDGKANAERRARNALFPLLRDSANLQVPEGKYVLALGPTHYLADEDKARLGADKANGAVLLKRRGNVIAIAGSPFEDPWRGSYAAMSEFLSRIAGVRFYAPDDLWVSRPGTSKMTIGDLDFYRAEPFLTTYLAPNIPRNLEWSRMNGDSNRLVINTNHNLANIFPPDKYGQTHPEIYELRAGERRIPTSVGTKVWNPSLVAPALPDLALDYIRERMKAQPATRYISFGMMDIDFDDQSPEAQESVRKYGDYSNLYYEFLNKVARQAAKEYPGLIITSYAYSNARKPPVGIKIEPNIAVKLVTKLYNGADPEYVDFETNRIKGFAAAGAKWFIHDWAFSGVTPRQTLHQYARFLQWGKQNGMLGAYIEWTPGESWYLEGGQYWILTQSLSDPYQDVDLLWKTYCRDMYGPAAEPMFEFFQSFQSKSVFAPDLIEVRDLPRQEPALYTAEDLARQRALLERARAIAKDDPLIQQRLTKVFRYFRAHELFALATNKPHSLDWQFRQAGRTGVNKELLAYYMQDDGKSLDEAIRYYASERTQAPDSNSMEVALGLPTSYVNNYTRGIASLLRTIRTQASANVDLAAPGPLKAEKIAAAAHDILRANLPAKANPARLKTFDQILSKNLFIPTGTEAPKLDGDLSDTAWKAAAPLTGFSERDTLRVPKDETSGQVMRIGDKLYVAIQAKQTGPIWAQSSKETVTGTHIWRESGLEFFFGPPQASEDDTPPYAQYIVNAFGSFRGFAAAKDNRAGVEVATKLDEKAGTYTVEAAFPLKAAGYDYTQAGTLTFNVLRNVFTRDSYQADVIIGWYPVFFTGSLAESRGLVFLK